MTTKYTYLGEYTNDKGTETTTVDKRISEAHAVVNEILVVVNLEELKHRHMEIGIKLATACLDAKLLYRPNAKTGTKIKSSDIKKLETVQTTFYKRLTEFQGEHQT